MILLQIQQVSKYFGTDVIFKNIKLNIQTNERIALVGRNGVGKSTLLKIIAGQINYDEGSISKPKHVQIGYLAQDTGLKSNRTIWDEMLTVFTGLRQMEKNLYELEQKLAEPTLYHDENEAKKVLEDYDQMQYQFKERGGYQYQANIRSILYGLHFYQNDFDKLVSSLSGGQKTRLALAKLLLSNQDILILDEPTNHLDIETLTWLESYLQTYKGALLVVSHDRYFLDKIVNQVYEMSHSKVENYKGNYSAYLIQKQAKLEQEWKKYTKQQTQIAKLEDFVVRNIARASTTKRAQSRRKQLEKIEQLERPQSEEKKAHFGFHFERPSGKDVLAVCNLAIGYQVNKTVATQICFEIKRGDRVALVGPNGVGKSTLLKTLVNELPKISGHFQFGAGIKLGYYDQEQAKLTSNKMVLNELWDEYPALSEKTIRTILGNFLFSEDDVLKIVHTLSGGEKARLALAKLTLIGANLLILDEPTNHLDIESKEVIETALMDFKGTILFVSHDRYFINRIATKIIELSQTGNTIYLGDYDYYKEKIAEKKEIARLDEMEKAQATSTLEAKKINTKTDYHKRKEEQKIKRQKERKLAEIEKQLEKNEAKIAELEVQLTQPEIYQDHKKSCAIIEEIGAIKQIIESLMNDWEILSEEY